MGSEAAHSLLSPSKRHRWGVCPGSVREEAKYPEPAENPAAIDGTRTHALLEELIAKRPTGQLPLRMPEQAIDLVREDEYGSYTIDAGRVERLNVAIDYIRAIPGAENAIAEQRVFPDGLVGRADLHGTVDVQIPGKQIYHIIDYKDGMSPVEAKDNPQLELYAAGVLAGLAYTPKSFQLTVIQPKLATRGMPVVSTWNLPTAALYNKVDDIRRQAAATDDPNAPLIPGESQCKYCKAKGACPALASKVMNEVSVMFSAIETPSLDVAQQAAQKDPTTMPDAELRQLMEAAPLLRQLIEGVEAEVKRRLTSGLKVPGFKLVRGKGSRSWSIPEEDVVKKLKAMGAPTSAIYETKLVSPAKAEKMVWTDKEGNVKKLSDLQIKRLCAEYVAVQAGAPVVAPESDTRAEVNPDVAGMFQPVVVDAVIVEPAPAPVPDWLQFPEWMK